MFGVVVVWDTVCFGFGCEWCCFAIVLLCEALAMRSSLQWVDYEARSVLMWVSWSVCPQRKCFYLGVLRMELARGSTAARWQLWELRAAFH